jgi:hypothetical protein
MTMMMAPPAMPMMRMSNIDYNLRARRWNQRHEKHQSEKSKSQLLHDAHGIPPLSEISTQCCNSSTRSPTSRKQPNPSCLELGPVRHSLYRPKPASGNDDGDGCTSNAGDVGVQLQPLPERSLKVPAAQGT